MKLWLITTCLGLYGLVVAESSDVDAKSKSSSDSEMMMRSPIKNQSKAPVLREKYDDLFYDLEDPNNFPEYQDLDLESDADHLSRNKRALGFNPWLYNDYRGSRRVPYINRFVGQNGSPMRTPLMSADQYNKLLRSRISKRNAFSIPNQYRLFPVKNKFRGSINCKSYAWKTPRACRFLRR